MMNIIREYINTINLNDYDLGGCEITDEDIEIIAKRWESHKDIGEVVSEYLCGIRNILD